MSVTRILAATPLLIAFPAFVQAQTTDDPFPSPIAQTEGVIRVDYAEFTSIPDIDGEPARLMHLVDEPGTERIFVSDMRGLLYGMDYEGENVTEYLDLRDPRWAVDVQASSRETGLQSFAFHPQFAEAGTDGYGKFYTWVDSNDTGPEADYTSGTDESAQHTLLLEWTAETPGAATYDGGAPRTLLRLEQPFGNHNGGMIGFNPLASPGDTDFGLLYVGIGDGGAGGDPFDLAQNLGNAFGKIFRIDPLGSNSDNGEYGIPAENPFADDGDDGTLGEIYAYGVRNPQRFAWDSENGNMFLADIGQNIVEELSIVTRGANMGWNDWEGSYRFISRSEVSLDDPRSDESVTYPIAEYGQLDPLLQRGSASTGVHVYRSNDIPQLEDVVIWGDMPSGEIFYIQADNLPGGGQAPIHRILLNDDGEAKTLLEVIREKNAEQGREPAQRADMRIASGPDGQVFLLNKSDGILRVLTSEGM